MPSIIDPFITILLVSQSRLTGPLPAKMFMPQLVQFSIFATGMEQWSNTSLRNSRGENLPEYLCAPSWWTPTPALSAGG